MQRIWLLPELGVQPTVPCPCHQGFPEILRTLGTVVAMESGNRLQLIYILGNRSALAFLDIKRYGLAFGKRLKSRIID